MLLFKAKKEHLMNKYYFIATIGLLSLYSCHQPTTEFEGTTSSGLPLHRPLYHFTPEKMWMNDPNGMVYYDGEYHLFYQHYPDSTVWGPMHWGHAVSEDLVHWEHLPIALYPDEHGLIFSGSAVIDWNNTSGFGKDEVPPMVAIFTYHDMAGEKAGVDTFQTQGIAYSLDKGRTWSKYEGNPVIPNPGIRDFRDPKVFWHQPSQKWVMIFAAGDRVKLYHSPDLKSWTFSSDFGLGLGSQGRPWECPDLFELEEQDTGEKKWCMLVSIGRGAPNGGSGTQYFIGDFDGETFSLDEQFSESLKKDTAYWVDWGKDNYAGVTWSDIPAEDGRRLFIGWMSNWQYATVVPTETWRSAMTLPRSLHLVATTGGPRLISQPVKELEQLRVKSKKLKATQELYYYIGELEATFDLSKADDKVGFELSNSLGEKVIIGYDLSGKVFFVDRTLSGKIDFSEDFPGVHTAPRTSEESRLDMHLFIDRTSVELFADGGKVAITEIFFPNEDFITLQVLGKAALANGQFYSLK